MDVKGPNQYIVNTIIVMQLKDRDVTTKTPAQIEKEQPSSRVIHINIENKKQC